MKLLALLLTTPVVGLLMLFLSVVWMLKDEKDKTRPILVIALVINLFYGWFLTTVMGKADGLLPWKYDYPLYRIDGVLGVSAAWVALALRDMRELLRLVYELMLPMMILWVVVNRKRNDGGSLALAYVAELTVGPLLYTIVPAVGPASTFGSRWLHPPVVQTHLAKLSGMPNAFPSLHLATALVFVLFAKTKLWWGVSWAFLIGTALATLTTGEHYAIDLVGGLAFGCFAANAGRRRIWRALPYLAIVLSWSLAIRFGSALLIAHPDLVRSFAVLTLAVALHAVWSEWRILTRGAEQIDVSKVVWAHEMGPACLSGD